MKIKTKISYYEGYLPTKRHRKLRYRLIEEEVDLSVNKVSKKEAPVAFIIHEAIKNELKEYRLWNDKIWRPVLYNEKVARTEGLYPVKEFIKSIEHYNSFSHEESKEAAVEKKEKYVQKYLIIDNIVYREIGEPRYVVMTFGLGHNHGGTSLMIDYYYNPNISKDRYFNALERDEAIELAKETATRRGDTESIDRIGKSCNIEVLIPEVVKCNPQKEHGEGDPFINTINGITENASSSIEAGLMAMALTFAEIKK